MSERGYLDGVPLRLNSKFYPQLRPQFKEIDIHIPVDALQDEYDFSLERGTLMEVEAWEEEQIVKQERRAMQAKQEEEARLQAEIKRKLFEEEEKVRLALEEEERARLAEEERIRLEQEEAIRLAQEVERARLSEEERIRLEKEDRIRVALEEEKLRLEQEDRNRLALEVEIARLADEEERIRLEEEDRIRLAVEVERTRLADSHLTGQLPQLTGYPINSEPPLSAYPQPQPQPPSQWNPNYYVPASPSAPDLTGRINNITANPTTTCQTNNAPLPPCSVNSFKKYYFPLLTSMADSRSLRDRQNQFSSNLNQTYNPHSSTNQVSSSNQNPYLCSNPPTVQQFPILGSLSHPPSNHMWPGGTGITSPMTYNNPTLNGPLAHDSSVLKINENRLPSPDLSGPSSNGTHHTLR